MAGLSKKFAEGEITIDRPSEVAFVAVLSGRLEPAAADWLISQLESNIVDGQTHFHVDTVGLKSFGAGFQGAMRTWLLQNRSRLAGAHVLTDRTMIRMAGAVANIALGGFITMHPDEESFWQAAMGTREKTGDS